MKLKISTLDLFLAIVVAASWGFNMVFTKIALDVIPVYTLLFVRFTALSLILFPFYYKPPTPVTKIIPVAVVFTLLHLGAMFGSLRMGLNSSIAVLISQLGIPFFLIMSIFAFGDKINRKLIIGIILALAGTFILFHNPHSISNIFAFLLMIASSFFWSFYSILIKKFSGTNPMALISWVSFISVPLSLIMAVLFEDLGIGTALKHLSYIDYKHILSIIYICIVPSIFGHGLWTYLLSKNSASSISSVILLVPLFGVFGSVIFLYEKLTIDLIIGGSFMVIGVALDLFNREKQVISQKQDIE